LIRDAIVMAAGEGSRLRPLTDRWPKAILPIDGKPVIATQLRELADAGIERATVVTGHLAEQVEALVREGFPLEVRFVRQPEPAGSADAVARALGRSDVGVRLHKAEVYTAAVETLVLAADTVFTPGDVGTFARAFAASEAAGAIAVRRDPQPDPPHRNGVRVVDGRVTAVFDQDPGNPFAGAPLWALRDPLVPLLCRDERPYELGRAFQRAVDEGITVIGVEIGRTRDLTHPVDLVERNFPYLRR
jgi:NDP-sugar pyrophosphorylase family protein